MVSGVNLGANMGDDTIYSGTVAAAAEGYLLGIPSVAVSLTSKTGEHFESAIGVALQIVERLKRRPFAEPVLLNVNVPDVAPAALRGIEVTRLGRRHKAEPVVKLQTPRGETAFWIGPAGGAADAGPGHRLPRGRGAPRVGDAAAHGPHAQRAARGGEGMAGSGEKHVAGIGMTSQRTRARMVERLREQGIRDERVLAAMAAVPRHLFVEEALASRAYEDTALPIGFGQTISQPYVVAR